MKTHDEHTTDRVAELLQQSGPRPLPSRAGLEAARAEARAAWQSELWIRQRRMRVGRAIFAMATAAMLVLAIMRYRSPEIARTVAVARVQESGATLSVNDVFHTIAGQRARLTLTNGVELRLDADTAIRFADLGAIALERGAIFVDTGSSHSPGRSVEVRTPAGIARDIGTKFEVRVLAGTTRVRVRDGIVQLTHGGATHTAQRGVELLADASGVTQNNAPIAGADWTWVALAAAPFEVEGKTLAEFLEWVAREGGWEIRFADDALRQSSASIVLHGSIAGLTPEQALETILPTCGLTHRIERDAVIVRAAPRSGDRK